MMLLTEYLNNWYLANEAALLRAGCEVTIFGPKEVPGTIFVEITIQRPGLAFGVMAWDNGDFHLSWITRNEDGSITDTLDSLEFKSPEESRPFLEQALWTFLGPE
jgi:hypothetical protein